MKLRVVDRVLSAPGRHEVAEIIAHANRYGYTLPRGGSPWDAGQMTIRLIGLGPAALDVEVTFEPDATFETPATPASRKPYTITWVYPTPPDLPGKKAVFARVESGTRRAQVTVEMTEGYVWLARSEGEAVGTGLVHETSEAITDTVTLLEVAERMAERLGQWLNGED